MLWLLKMILLNDVCIITGQRRWEKPKRASRCHYIFQSFSRGDGEHGDPCGAQHPDDGGFGLHRHQLGCHSGVSGLTGCKPLSPLEGPFAGLVCCCSFAVLSATCSGGAQLRPAGASGGVPEGRGQKAKIVASQRKAVWLVKQCQFC